ncbi:hypothetical protein [Sulfitobacter sp. 1A13679]|uniref:hypothetical protein n=1 Tax=Sulfitobacter sp. 1A13679 TaxID=3368597 RepID=UPI0037459261
MAYRIRITKGGLFGNTGELPIGEEFTLEGKPPAGWAGRYEMVSQTDDKEPVTANGDMSDDRKAVILEAIGGLDPEKDYTKGGKPDVDAINALMPEGAETVTAAERDEVIKED